MYVVTKKLASLLRIVLLTYDLHLVYTSYARMLVQLKLKHSAEKNRVLLYSPTAIGLLCFKFCRIYLRSFALSQCL